ncbi:unnamed protein product [Schistosoma margrebowiei]|uniref:Uncharacterized protein n=1 Tax=Schistosoma margrebowiei TaxID=48269 RepID=A0A183LI15_9TREM|nr:unnamed protein product [Schistosoma margrebowiei]
MHQQIKQKTTSVAADSAAISLNIQKGKSKILRYNTARLIPIALDEEDLEDVKNLYISGSIIDKHSGYDASVGAGRKCKSTIFTTEENLGLEKTVNQHQYQNFQYECQDSSTVWEKNLES